MPLDAMTVAALTQELETKLAGARIDKLRQPERDILILNIRGAEGGARLLLCAGAGSARAHLTEAEFENPASPPMFCMLLRKHLQGGRIASVTQPEGERIIVFGVEAMDELGVISEKKLAVEMMGRGTNIVLVGADGRIIDCLRRVDAPARQVLPGLYYRLPPKQSKADFLTAGSVKRSELWAAADGDLTADEWMLKTFSGISPLICREICHRAFGECSPRISSLGTERRALLPAAMDALAETVERREWTPTLITSGGRPMDFSFMAIAQYAREAECERMGSFSELLDAFYTRRDKLERARQRAADVTRTVKNARDRAARRLAAQKQELRKTADRDRLRQLGDIITANLYRMKKGMDVLTAQDYYADGMPEISIALDPLKTPQQNAAKYYKDYNKAKNAEKYLSEQIELGEREHRYLSSVLEELGRAEGERDIAEIRRELTETGYIKSRSGAKREKAQPSKPRRFRSESGFEIYVGRSNAQNDALTLKSALKSDIWLHVQRLHGSHVIISCRGGEPDADTLMMAASLAAYYSEGREAGKTPVDYTRVRYVKKPAGAMPGMVIYTDYKTVIAEPKAYEEYELK